MPNINDILSRRKKKSIDTSKSDTVLKSISTAVDLVVPKVLDRKFPKIIDELTQHLNHELDKVLGKVKDGADGVDGIDGTDGQPGIDGAPGQPGEPGKDGYDGIDGKDGKPGTDGLEGKPGLDGSKGDKGDRGDAGSPDTAKEIAGKLNTKKDIVERKVIKGLDEELRRVARKKGGGISNTQRDNIILNNTHRASDGKDHSDVVLNNTHRTTVTGNPHNVTATQVGLGNVTNVATSDTAYDATSWDANTDAATKNAIRDKVETMDTAIGLNTAKDTNVTTNLSLGAVDATTMVVASSDGTDATLIEADTNNAGLLGADKWDEIVANSLKDTNVSTNLSEGTSTTTTVDVNSSDGTNATLVAASTSRAGLLTKAKFDEVVVNTAHTTANTTKTFALTVLDPTATQALTNEVFIAWTNAAITITKIQVELDTATAVTADLKWADDFVALTNAALIDVIDTAATGKFTATSGFDDATIASGKGIYLSFDGAPSATPKQYHLQISYTID
jgi:hypothetical protein